MSYRWIVDWYAGANRKADRVRHCSIRHDPASPQPAGVVVVPDCHVAVLVKADGDVVLLDRGAGGGSSRRAVEHDSCW